MSRCGRCFEGVTKNDFNSFFGQDNKYGALKNVFHVKNFKDIVNKPPYLDNMLVKEKLCTRFSPNGLQHSDNFSATLMRALQYQRLLAPSKYNAAVEKYVTPVMNVERKAPTRYNDNDDVDSDNSTPPRKRGKKEDSDVDYMERFYCFLLGTEVNANDSGQLQWIQRDNMHPLFNKLKGSCRFVTEVQGIRSKWDLNLRKNVVTST